MKKAILLIFLCFLASGPVHAQSAGEQEHIEAAVGACYYSLYAEKGKVIDEWNERTFDKVNECLSQYGVRGDFEHSALYDGGHDDEGDEDFPDQIFELTKEGKELVRLQTELGRPSIAKDDLVKSIYKTSPEIPDSYSLKNTDDKKTKYMYQKRGGFKQ
jgi:hypothetical protein